MMDCCNPDKGFFYGYCEHCKKDITFHISCNGKMCSRCGKRYVNNWVKNARNKVPNEMHRLVTLTVPADLRPILKDNWKLLKIMQDSAAQTIKEVAELTLKRKGLKVGILVGLQTYGQDLKFNPHLHCLVLERVQYKGKMLNFNYIPKKLLNKKWQYIVITNLAKADINPEDKHKIHEMFQQYPLGFVTDVGKRGMNGIAVIRYIARYVRHPPIANSRLLYENGKVLVKCKSKRGRQFYVEFTVNEFISRLLAHIPPKNFKLVRWYGLYSRRQVRLTRKQSKQETIGLFLPGKKRHFKCPKCENPIEIDFIAPYEDKGPPSKHIIGNLLSDWIS